MIWFITGVVVGTLSAIGQGRLVERPLVVLSLASVSIPVFFLGAMLLYLFAYKVRLFPNTGYVGITTSPTEWAYHLVLPWLALSAAFSGIYARVLRASFLDVMHDDYVRTARAKGLSEARVLTRHVLRCALIPIISLWGLDAAAVIGGGAILTESVFNIPGVGQYAAQAISQLDVPPILVITMFTAVVVVIASTMVDIVYTWLDPRIRLDA